MSPSRRSRVRLALEGRARILGSVLLALALAACGRRDAAPDAPRESVDPPPRRFATVAWREAWRVGGSLADTLLLQPGRLAADGDGVVVIDLHGGRTMRFDREGELRWSWGRKGRGPNELAHPRDVKLDARGRTWILDVENGRIVVLSAEGRVVGRIRLEGAGGRPDDLVPLEDGGALLLVADARRPLVRIGPDGTPLARHPLPWPELASLDPLVGQLTVGSDPASGRWAAAFQLGDGFAAFQGERWLGYRCRFVESVPFGRAVRHRSRGRLGRRETVTALASPTFAAWSVTLTDEDVGVLFVGRTDLAGRLLDLYRLDDGAYRETLLLPRTVSQVAWGDGTLYATFADPLPTLVAWRPAPGPDEPAQPPGPGERAESPEPAAPSPPSR